MRIGLGSQPEPSRSCSAREAVEIYLIDGQLDSACLEIGAFVAESAEVKHATQPNSDASIVE